jgi:hypothetical protein
MTKNVTTYCSDKAVLTTIHWQTVAHEKQSDSRRRPFLIITADATTADGVFSWGERRLEAEELWFVFASDRDEAIAQVYELLDPNIAAVLALDVNDMRSLAGAMEENSLKAEFPVKVETPWCAAVALGSPCNTPTHQPRSSRPD